uniref:DH domain-containing protein n=1 Tax=Rhabditophanes sp. KR3021 TaxID=114890 RepID=A0AC35TKY7_9BILA
MSSCGRSRARRPSLVDYYHDGPKRYQSLDFEQRFDRDPANSILVEICEEDPPNSANPVEQIPISAGKKLKELIEPILRRRGIALDQVEFTLDKSNSPIPEGSDSIYLAGQKIYVKGRRGMRLGNNRPKNFFSVDSDNIYVDPYATIGSMNGNSLNMFQQLHHNPSIKGVLPPTRKMSADSISRKSSFLSKSRNTSISSASPQEVIPANTTCAPTPVHNCNGDANSYNTSVDSASSLTGSTFPSTQGNNPTDSGGYSRNTRKISCGPPTNSSGGFLFCNPNQPVDELSVNRQPLVGHQSSVNCINVNGSSTNLTITANMPSVQMSGYGCSGESHQVATNYTQIPHMSGEESGTRRARSLTANKMSIFSGNKDKHQEMYNLLEILKEDRSKRNDLGDFFLENEWTDIVKNHKELSKQVIEQQKRLWELITTEQRYICLLKQMDELCYYFNQMQEHSYMRDINGQRVFLNYADLFKCNKMFWQKAILPILQDSRKNGTPMQATLLYEGFEDMIEWSKFYIYFNLNYSDTHAYIKKKLETHDCFRDFVVWAEALETMKRQTLSDTLTMPMQRITRYSLLLNAYLKTVTNKKEADIFQDMIGRADASVGNLNYEMNNRKLQLRLIQIMATIEGYDVVDNDEFERIYKKNSRDILDLTKPMPYLMGPPRYREICHRGDMKMKEGKNGAKIEVHCFLFTDMFLICKPITKSKERLRILKAPMHITNIGIIPYPEYTAFYLMHTNEFDALNSLYIMQAPNSDENRRWFDSLSAAQLKFRNLRILADPMAEFTQYEHLPADHPLYHATQHSCEGSNYDPSVPSRRMSYGVSNGYIENGHHPAEMNIVSHRKSSSMDSQVIAAQSQAARMFTGRSSTTINNNYRSSEMYNGSLSAREPHHTVVQYLNTERSRRKLNSLEAIPSIPISQSKSSVDLNAKNGEVSIHESMATLSPPRRRSRSNSSGHVSPKQNQRSCNGSPTGFLKKTIVNNTDNDAKIAAELQVAVWTGDDIIRNDRSVAEKIDESILEEQNNNDIFPPPSTGPSTSNGLLGRRGYDRRYHTADQIDNMKPKHVGSLQNTIAKRFSWSLTAAVSGSYRKINNRLLEQSLRKNSQSSTLASSDSFGSSTSGISSSSSHDPNGIVIHTLDHGEPSTTFRSPHIMTVAIGEQPSSSNSSPNSTIQRVNTLPVRDPTLREETISVTSRTSSATPPPLPQVPPPSVAIITTDGKSFNKSEDIIKFILDDQNETTDV